MTTSPHPVSDAPITALRHKRLLIVEDECIVAFDLRVVLEELGYAVVGTAASSDEALRIADEQRPDLVLMDISIVGQTDGVQAGRLLRARHHVPLVYLTANVDAATLGRALATEPAGYVVKPYNEHSLRTTIEVALRRHEADQALERSHERERAQFEQKYSDMTNLARRLRREATRDPLTGLHNRRHLQYTMKREIGFAQRDGHPVAFVLIDLDRFKQLNDSFGHAAGDAALRAVADLLRARIRIYDVACRYGGEEIVVVVPGATTAGAAALAEDLRAGIGEIRIPCDGGRVARFTASFGVASFPEHGWDTATALRAADQALYRAKAAGRNRVVVATGGDASPADSPARAVPGGSAKLGDGGEDGVGMTGERVLTSELAIIDDLEE
jgi:diguanylate cyclase (GGDEF)-like protein